MSYGTATGVQLELGVETDDVFYDATRIAAAIVKADVWVDLINSDATAARKTEASEIIAAGILLRANMNRQLRGVSSDSGNESRSAKSGANRPYTPPKAVYRILGIQRLPTVTSVTPKSTGEW